MPAGARLAGCSAAGSLPAAQLASQELLRHRAVVDVGDDAVPVEPDAGGEGRAGAKGSADVAGRIQRHRELHTKGIGELLDDAGVLLLVDGDDLEALAVVLRVG